MAGFGASGRNGGWCSALFATSDAALARRHGRDAMVAMRRAMQDTVDVVGASAAADGIDCQYAKGGTVDLVRSPHRSPGPGPSWTNSGRSASGRTTCAGSAPRRHAP